jgi:predicted peptidase
LVTLATQKLIPAFAFLFFLPLFIAGCATTSFVSQEKAAMAGIPTGFIQQTMQVRGQDRAYAVYVPREYDPSRKWPLVVFLHGAGERGDDGLQQTDVGIGRAIRRNADRFPCIVVMPQCPEGVWWDKALEDVGRAMELTLEAYAIDSSRVYLTGISMGGYATWLYGAKHAETFAALLPICGGGKVEHAPQLAQIPIWAFHGALDDVVLPEESRKMVKAVKEAGGSVQYTEYNDASHNSWDAAYENKKAIRWLLSQRK